MPFNSTVRIVSRENPGRQLTVHAVARQDQDPLSPGEMEFGYVNTDGVYVPVVGASTFSDLVRNFVQPSISFVDNSGLETTDYCLTELDENRSFTARFIISSLRFPAAGITFNATVIEPYIASQFNSPVVRLPMTMGNPPMSTATKIRVTRTMVALFPTPGARNDIVFGDGLYTFRMFRDFPQHASFSVFAEIISDESAFDLTIGADGQQIPTETVDLRVRYNPQITAGLDAFYERERYRIVGVEHETRYRYSRISLSRIVG